MSAFKLSNTFPGIYKGVLFLRQTTLVYDSIFTVNSIVFWEEHMNQFLLLTFTAAPFEVTLKPGFIYLHPHYCCRFY